MNSCLECVKVECLCVFSLTQIGPLSCHFISGKKKPGGTTRQTWPLDQEKRLRGLFREEMMQGRLPGRTVCLEAMIKYPHALKWQNMKYKIRNMTISDARK